MRQLLEVNRRLFFTIFQRYPFQTKYEVIRPTDIDLHRPPANFRQTFLQREAFFYPQNIGVEGGGSFKWVIIIYAPTPLLLLTKTRKF